MAEAKRGRPTKDASRAKARAEALRKRDGFREVLHDGQRLRLQGKAFEAADGFRNVWVNDTKGGIQDYERVGYERVADGDGKPISQVVGRDPVSGEGGMRAYLMEIPEEIAAERDAALQKQIVDVTRQKAQQLGEGEYVPNGQAAPLQEGSSVMDEFTPASSPLR